MWGLWRNMGAGRFSNIDGLRAIAAISVLFHHILGDFLREASNQNTTT
ncbi:MAG: acyltransferase, partial [Brucella intermedia]